MSARATWGHLGNGDLRAFDDLGKELIRLAMERGGEGRVSSKGHVILRSPSGATMAVARNLKSGNRGAQNARSQFVKVFGPLDESPEWAQVPAPEKEPEPELVPVGSGEPTLTCPVSTCDAVFVTEGARYSHCEKVHHKCAQPGCGFVGKSAQSIRAHVRIVHEGFRPAKGTSKVRKVTDTLDQIRELLGEDPRIKELEAQVARLEKANDELRKQLAKIKEALK